MVVSREGLDEKANQKADKRRPFKGLFLKLLGVLFSTLMALLLGELLFRFLGVAPAFRPIVITDSETVYQRSSNPILGYELKAGYRDPEADLVTSYPYTNAHGQRDIERALAKPVGSKRIALIGDSVVEGLGVREIDQLIHRQLEQLFSDREVAVEVLNFGVSGYNTLAAIELLKVKGMTFQPDIVVLVFVENDFNNFNREAFDLASKGARPGWSKVLFRHSSLARTCFVRLNLFGFGADSNPGKWNKEAMGDNNVVEGLQQFRAMATQAGFEPLIGIWPRFSNDGISDQIYFREDEDVLLIEALASDAGIASFRFSEGFRKDWQKRQARNPRLIYTIGDEMHPNTEGIGVAARILKETIDWWESDRQQSVQAGEARADSSSRAIAMAQDLGEQNEPNPAVVHYNRARRLEAEGRVREAEAEYRAAIASDPRMAQAYNNLGILLAQQDQIETALASFEKAVQLRSNFGEAQMNLGNAYLVLNRVDEARVALEGAVASDPELLEARFMLGQVDYSTGMLRSAEEALRGLLKKDPEHVGGLHLLAVILANSERREEALIMLKKGQTLAPDDQDIQSALNQLQQSGAR